jgi:hypothetical protein
MLCQFYILVDEGYLVWGSERGRPCHIETQTTATTSTTGGRGDELPPELCELCLELTDVVARGLVFLGWRNDMSKKESVNLAETHF